MNARLVALVLLAVTFQSVGQAMQQQGVAKAAPDLPARRFLLQSPRILRALTRNRMWVAGVAFGVLGAALGIEALAYGELIVVVPLLNLTIVVTALIGVLVFGERLTSMELLGLGVALAGALLLALQRDGSGFRDMSMRSAFALWLVVSTGTIGTLLAAGHRGWTSPEAGRALSAGMMFGVGNVLMKLALEGAESRCSAFSMLKHGCVTALLVEPLVCGIVVSELAGFALLQSAYSAGRVTVVGTLKTTSSLWSSATLGSVALGETLDGRRTAASLLIIVGTALLGAGQPRRKRASRC